MIAIILILIFVSFVQVTLLPWNFILIILIARSLIVRDRANFYLAFAFGILLSYLLGYPLGTLSLVYFLAVTVSYIVQRTQFASHSGIVLPLVIVLLFAQFLVERFLTGASFEIWLFLPPVILSLPIYFLVKFWEERFIPTREIKLKMGK